MALPGFDQDTGGAAPDLRSRLADRVRLERRRLKLTQPEFAARCGIPLRTYKRFEQGQCDSLEAFLRIVVGFQRVVALELLFPPKPVTASPSRSLDALLERVRQRSEK